MPTRRPEIRSGSDAISNLAERVRRLEDTNSDRVLPPGYVFVMDTDGDISIMRVSDGSSDEIASFP